MPKVVQTLPKQTNLRQGKKTMDDRKRYETVKSRLRTMAEGTAQQVHDSMEPTPYSVREVENTLDEMVIHERDDFEKVGGVYAHRINRSRGQSF
jgi:hypothetical protein